MVHCAFPVVQSGTFFHIKLHAVGTFKIIALRAPESPVAFSVFADITSEPNDLAVRKLTDNQAFQRVHRQIVVTHRRTFCDISKIVNGVALSKRFIFGR